MWPEHISFPEVLFGMDNPPLIALSGAQAEQLARRAAGARGLQWPSDPRDVRGVGAFSAELTNLPGRETVAWATLGKNDGVLGLFSEAGKLLASANDSLAEVLRVQVASLPGLPHGALIVDDRYDELVGAFLREERQRIYVWDGRGLREVFRGPLSGEQYTHAQWENPRAPQVWQLLRTAADIHLRDGVLTHVIREHKLQAPGSARSPIPPASSFRLVSEKVEERRYIWNSRLRRFEAA